MNSRMRKCTGCAQYTLLNECPHCGASTHNPLPARYSPEDRYGEYRRKLIIERCGENGKYTKCSDGKA